MAAQTTASRQKLAVLDTCVLFHLAEQHAPSHNLILRLVRNGFSPVVVQTVVQELGDLAQNDPAPRKRLMAHTALASMLSWGIQPVALKPVGNGICEIICDVIAGRGLLPAAERNDACIVVESSFWGAAMLITWDRHLLDAPQDALNEVLKTFDLQPIQIIHPKIVLGY